MLKNRCLIDPSDFTREEFREIFDLAHQIVENPEKFGKSCEGKILATLFYEPSTRTRLALKQQCCVLAEKSSVFQNRIQVQRPREKVLPIPFVQFSAMPISPL